MIWPYLVGGAISYFAGACGMIKLWYIFGDYSPGSDGGYVKDFFYLIRLDRYSSYIEVHQMKIFAFFMWIPLTIFTIMVLPFKIIFSARGLLTKTIDLVVSPPGPKRLK